MLFVFDVIVIFFLKQEVSERRSISTAIQNGRIAKRLMEDIAKRSGNGMEAVYDLGAIRCSGVVLARPPLSPKLYAPFSPIASAVVFPVSRFQFMLPANCFGNVHSISSVEDRK